MEPNVPDPPIGSFTGDILNPVLWKGKLVVSEVKALTFCEITRNEMVRTTWHVEGQHVNISTVNHTEPCVRNSFRYFVFEGKYNYEENYDLCSKLQLTMISPENLDQLSLLRSNLRIGECPENKIWLWVDGKDAVSHFDTHEFKCSALTATAIETLPCSRAMCSGCQLDSPKLFFLRGLCHRGEADLAFVLSRENGLGYYFKGIERYEIKKDDSNWTLSDSSSGTKLAFVQSSDPFGINNWIVLSPLCSRASGSVVKLSLSSCTDGYTPCKSGLCISATKRCNLFPDCPEGEDEENCERVQPKARMLQSTPVGSMVKDITVSIDILQVIQVSEDQLRFLLLLQFLWSDSSVNFLNVNPSGQSTLPSGADLWMPTYQVYYSDQNVPSQSTRSPCRRSEKEIPVATVSYDGSQEEHELRNTPHADVVYPGDNATIKLSEFLLEEMDCLSEYPFFPFDTVKCKINFVLFPRPSSQVKISGGSASSRYTGPLHVYHYTFTETSVTVTDMELRGVNHSGVVLTANLRRRHFLYVANVFIPSLCLLLVNTFTLWIGEAQGNPTRLYVTFCVLLLLFLTWVIMMQEIPKHRYVTALYVWMCFCVIFTFLHVGVHILLDICKAHTPPLSLSRRSSRNANGRATQVKPIDAVSLYDELVIRVPLDNAEIWTITYWITYIARIVSPLLLVAFNAIYWPFVLYYSGSHLT